MAPRTKARRGKSLVASLRSFWRSLVRGEKHWLYSTAKQRLGTRGERAARNYLRSHGYNILETNVMGRAGEIDIIARDGQVLCFIEVRSMTVNSRVAREPALDRAKQRRFTTSMDDIVKKQGWAKRHRRADLVEVYFSAKRKVERIELYKGAFAEDTRRR
jgi:putative endonuclease